MSEMVRRVARAIDEALTGAVFVNPYDDEAVKRVRIALDTAAHAAIAEVLKQP